MRWLVHCSYSDPLRRQLTEAILITKQGKLNGKYEFGVNEIYKFQCSATGQEQDELMRTELEKRQRDRVRVQNFIDVMTIVCCNSTQTIDNSRSEKRTVDIDCSQLIPDVTSPDLEPCGRNTSDSTGDIVPGSPTELSGNLEKNKLTPEP